MKIDSILKQADLFEKLSLSEDRIGFLKILAQGEVGPDSRLEGIRGAIKQYMQKMPVAYSNRDPQTVEQLRTAIKEMRGYSEASKLPQFIGSLNQFEAELSKIQHAIPRIDIPTPTYPKTPDTNLKIRTQRPSEFSSNHSALMTAIGASNVQSVNSILPKYTSSVEKMITRTEGIVFAPEFLAQQSKIEGALQKLTQMVSDKKDPMLYQLVDRLKSVVANAKSDIGQISDRDKATQQTNEMLGKSIK